MSILKWLGASIGWSFGGPIGAIIGLALGSVADVMNKGGDNPLLGENNHRNKHKSRTRRQQSQTQSGDFEISLLILA